MRRTVSASLFLRLLSLLWLTPFFFSCSKPASTSQTQILRISQRNEPADLDPATATLPDEFFVIRALSEGLLVPDPAGGAPLPAAAERFDVSPDGLTYTFHLRADAKWSNGEPLTATDFIASYRRLLTPATAAPKAHLFYAVKNARAFLTGALADFSAVGFAAPDARTLVVTLAQPAPRFPYYVASGPWIPTNPRVVAQHGRAWTQPAHFVGNGPFTLAEWRPQQRIVVKKNPAYHAAAAVRLDEIQFLRFDDENTEERAFRAAQIDVTMTVPFTKLEPYAREHPAELHRAPLAETRYLAFNTRRPPLDDPRVRRALSLAIDRQRIVELVLRGGQAPATQFLPPELLPSHPSHPSPSSHPSYSPTLARDLLAAAGFSDGKNFPRLELSGWAHNPTLDAVQAQWKNELGIDVALVVRDAKVHVAALTAGTYDIGFITAIPDVADPADFLARFATAAPENYPHWSDAAFDRALAAADFAAAERRLLEAAAIAPLYFNAHNWLMSPRVTGWQEDALWTRRYVGVSLEKK